MTNTLQFLLAGNAIFTVRSKRTGTRFTYRIKRSKTKGLYLVSVLRGPDNEKDFTFFGSIVNGTFHQSRKSRLYSDAPSSVAFRWFWGHVDSDQIEIHHAGKCGRCGRKLTTPESIEKGLGPYCAEVS
jgi:hypothetical protein